jgi:hypothetical protein
MLRGIMGLEPLRLLSFSVLVLLALGGVSLLWYRLSARRYQRLAAWRELCLRLELVPESGDGRVASGQFQGCRFRLHDTGSRWLLEMPLPEPLLPPGVVLLSEKAPRLRPFSWLHPLRWGSRLRPLPLSSTAVPPVPVDWYVERRVPLSKAEASAAFLEEAGRAAQAHAPLRVEPRRMVHALRAGALPSVSDIRGAVRALEATARRWLEAVGGHGIPRLEALWLPSALTLLRGVLARHPPSFFMPARVTRISLRKVLWGLGLFIGIMATFFIWVRSMLMGVPSVWGLVVSTLVLGTLLFCFWIRGDGQAEEEKARLNHQLLVVSFPPKKGMNPVGWLIKVLFLWAREFRQSRRVLRKR